MISCRDSIRTVIRGEQVTGSTVLRRGPQKTYEIKLYPFYGTQNNAVIINGCVFIANDTSKKIELEEKIFQAEKLVSIANLDEKSENINKSLEIDNK